MCLCRTFQNMGGHVSFLDELSLSIRGKNHGYLESFHSPKQVPKGSCFLKHSSCIILQTCYLFLQKNTHWCKNVCHLLFSRKRHFSPLMFTVQSSEYRVFFIMASASRARSTCRINQSSCDSSAGVCLAGNQITLSKWPLWWQCRHSGHYD